MNCFFIIHLLMAFVFVIGAGYHCKLIGEGQLYNYISAAIWALDRLLRLVRIAWSGALSKARMTLHNDGTVEMDVDNSGRWKVYQVSFVFVHIMRKNGF